MFGRGGPLLVLMLALTGGCKGRATAPVGSAPAIVADPFAAPSDLRAPPPDAVRSPSGLRSKVLHEGSGQRKPEAFDRVNVDYTGWTEQGTVFASSVRRGASVTFRTEDAVRGWAEGLQLMVAGEKRRLWIPEELAYAGKPGQPRGPLVIDVELLAVIPGTPPLAPPKNLLAPPPDAERTESGIAHALLAKGHGDRRPALHDRVRITYAGWSSDGRMIDSSQSRGDSVEVGVSQGFPGWREALLLLREGEKRRFWIPESLAYRQYPGALPGPLVFDIELRQIIAMPAPPAAPSDVAAPPKNAIRTTSGLAYRVLRKGTGKRKPDLESVVEIHYSYWTTDGRLVDSTIPNGRPQRAELEDRDLPPALSEAVQQMVVGEKRRLWAPEQLGYSNKGRPHTGMLVFDLELLALYEDNVKVESVAP